MPRLRTSTHKADRGCRDTLQANFAARAIAATASSVKNAVAASKAKIFGADAPVENDPTAMKKIAAADDDEDNAPVSPNGTQPKSMLDGEGKPVLFSAFRCAPRAIATKLPWLNIVSPL